jgi:hypothetical protein
MSFIVALRNPSGELYDVDAHLVRREVFVWRVSSTVLFNTERLAGLLSTLDGKPANVMVSLMTERPAMGLTWHDLGQVCILTQWAVDHPDGTWHCG